MRTEGDMELEQEWRAEEREIGAKRLRKSQFEHECLKESEVERVMDGE